MRKLLLTPILFCGFSLAVVAHEAPVVDAAQQQQQDAGVSTQAEASSGGSWQPVSESSTPSSASTSEWQPVRSSSAAQPAPSELAASTSNEVASESSESTTPSVTKSGTVSKRVARLEQQIANYNQMNLPQQVTDLQQKNAQLQGQLEVAQHNLTSLTDKQKLYYQDLEQQIAQLEKAKGIKPTAANQDASTASSDSNSNAASNANSNSASPGFVRKTKTPVNNDALTSGSDTENTASENNAQLAKATQAKPAPINLLDPKKDKMPSLSDADSYEKAFQSLSAKHFDDAQKQFQTYLTSYPKGRFAVNAHFWLGEIALMHEKYNAAKKQFETVVAQYPASPKVADAKLKIAMINAAQGKMELARSEFTQIRKHYPGSTAAQLASIRLQQLANATSVSVQ